MNHRKELAALAVTAGRDMVRIGMEHGIDSELAQRAAYVADQVTTAAEAAGCTAADYDEARRKAERIERQTELRKRQTKKK